MTLQLRALAALLEDLSSIPASHTVARSYGCDFSSRDSNTPFWPPQTPGTPVVHRHTWTYMQVKQVYTHTHTHTHTHTQIKTLFFFKVSFLVHGDTANFFLCRSNISCDCELEDLLPPYLSSCLDHIHNLRLEYEPSKKPSRGTATELLTALASRAPRLRGLRLECRGEKPLFDAGQDILGAVHAVCGAAHQLRHLDLRHLPYTLDDTLVLRAAAGCPELRSLFLNNHALVNSVQPTSVLKLLEACPHLRALGLHLASMSRAALELLAAPHRSPFALLALRCACPEDVRASPLPDEAWATLRCGHPGLEVELELEPVLPDEAVTRILQPAVPVAVLSLNLSGDTVGPVRFATRHYAETLRALEVRASASPELHTALEELAARCVGLREIHCFCVVRPSVLDAFRAHCPRLRSYTLKLKREPHPWRPTLVR